MGIENNNKSAKVKKKLTASDLWGAIIGFPLGFLIIGILNSFSEFGIGGLPTALILFGSFYAVKAMSLQLGRKNNPTAVVQQENASTETPLLTTERNQNGIQDAPLASVKKKSSTRQLIIIGLVIFVFLIIYSAIGANNSDPKKVDTDKSPTNDEQIGQMYRNKKYMFRIKFPDGWTVENADGPGLIKKASNKDASSVIVGVYEFDRDLLTSGKTVKGVLEETGGFKAIFPNAQVLEEGETKIDNKDAYRAHIKQDYQMLDLTVKMESVVYFLVYKKTMYVITTGAVEDKYERDFPDLYKSAGSFVIEDY